MRERSTKDDDGPPLSREKVINPPLLLLLPLHGLRHTPPRTTSSSPSNTPTIHLRQGKNVPFSSSSSSRKHGQLNIPRSRGGVRRERSNEEGTSTHTHKRPQWPSPPPTFPFANTKGGEGKLKSLFPTKETTWKAKKENKKASCCPPVLPSRPPLISTPARFSADEEGGERGDPFFP